MIDLSKRLDGSQRPSGVVLVLIWCSFTIVAGPLGAVAGGVTIAMRVVTNVPYTIATGHVALIGIFPAGIDSTAFLFIEAAFVLLLVVPSNQFESPRHFATVPIVCVLSLGAAAWLLVQYHGVAMAAAGLLAVVSLVSTALWWYERVHIGTTRFEASSGGTDL